MMKKGMSYYKDWINIFMFIVILLGFGAKAVLLTDQVNRNEKAIEEANLKVMIYKLEQIEEKVDLIYQILMKK